jgi:tetratricopeptide (TPR) repeat protein
MANAWTQEGMVRLLLDAALAHRVRGEWNRARTLMTEALELAEGEKQTAWVAAARASLGVLERDEGNLEAAGSQLQHAMRLRRENADRTGLARALGDLAGVHLDAGRPEDATTCIGEAMAISSGLDLGRTRAEVLEQGGLVHAHLGDRSRALDCFAESEEIYRGLGDLAAARRVRAQVERLGPKQEGSNLDSEITAIERSRLLSALEGEGWNQSRAARRLGVTETRVRNLMRRHGLKPRNRRGRPRKGAESSR